MRVHADRMTATTRRRIAALARRTGFEPAPRVSATPDLVVTAPRLRVNFASSL